MSYLGVRTRTGVTNIANPLGSGFWVVQFRVEDLYPEDFDVFHGAVKNGPPGMFQVYIDETFYSAAERGDINEYDPKNPMPVRRGQQIFFYFSAGASTSPSIPQVWLYARTPSIL